MDGIFIIGGIVVVGGVLALASLKTIRPTERGVIERLGAYNRFAKPGLNFIVPFIENLGTIDITEQIVDTGKQNIITKDALSAGVGTQDCQYQFTNLSKD